MRAVTSKLIVGNESTRKPLGITKWSFLVVIGFLSLIFGDVLNIQAVPPDDSQKADSLPENRIELQIEDEPDQQNLSTATDSLNADIRDAISMIEKKSAILFVHSFLPFEAQARYMRNAQKNHNLGLVEDLISAEDLREYRMHLKFTLNGKVQMNRAKTYAVVKYSLQADREAELTFNNYVPAFPNSPPTSVPGLGSDLKQMLQAAALLIETEDLEKFIQNVYPLSQLARLSNRKEMDQLLSRIDSDSMHKSMVRDLHAAAKAVAKIEGNTATIKLPPLVRGDSSRTLKFQKVEGNWRFFDASQAERKEIVRLASKPPERLTQKGRQRSIVFRRLTRSSEWRMTTSPVTLPKW